MEKVLREKLEKFEEECNWSGITPDDMVIIKSPQRPSSNLVCHGAVTKEFE